MSETNAEAVRTCYMAVDRGDWDLAFSACAPEFEWETDKRVPNAGVYRGRAAVEAFFRDQAAPFENRTLEPERLLSSGDQVLAFVKVRLRPRGSDAELMAEIAHLWTFRDGRCIRGQAFASRDEALEAAELAE